MLIQRKIPRRAEKLPAATTRAELSSLHCQPPGRVSTSLTDSSSPTPPALNRTSPGYSPTSPRYLPTSPSFSRTRWGRSCIRSLRPRGSTRSLPNLHTTLELYEVDAIAHRQPCHCACERHPIAVVRSAPSIATNCYYPRYAPSPSPASSVSPPTLLGIEDHTAKIVSASSPLGLSNADSIPSFVQKARCLLSPHPVW